MSPPVQAALGWDTLPRPVLAMHMWKPNEEPDLSEKSAEHYVQVRRPSPVLPIRSLPPPSCAVLRLL